ncbi:MAG: dihydrodipicolinate synthase family protein [Opitutales bacterium]|nr:dihydrodipicolinate synthase family protein [Opitutales bacterium]
MAHPNTTTLRGIWPPILIESGEDGRVDLEAVAMSVKHFAESGIHGIYTADTASEFYTMEFEEWEDLAVHFRAAAREAGLPAGIGCTWTNQAGSLKRIERARELGYDNIHLSQPYWVRLNSAAQETFWKAAGEAAGNDLKIIVYAGSQGQFPLDGESLLRLRNYCPAIAGSKSLGFDAVATNSLLARCPDLAHFVHEQVLCAWSALGAVGCFSNLAGLAPAFAVDWFGYIERGEWAAAFEIQRRVNRFYEEGAVPIRRAGYFLDKAMAVIGGVPGLTTRQRPPHASVPADLIDALRAAVRRHLPEIFSSPTSPERSEVPPERDSSPASSLE